MVAADDAEEGRMNTKLWSEIEPKDAVKLNAATDPDIIAPLNENGEPCPWPWEPQQLRGVPLGQYHCPYCGAMVIAGVPHLDYQEGKDQHA